MSSELVEIQPSILKFTFELGKQSSCVIQLTNKTENFVGFKSKEEVYKIKTTSPKKYVVKPNIGVIKAKGAAEFTVIMIAQSAAPPDLLCKDKFLIQTTIVPFGLTEENITSETFVKDPSKRIEEKKLKVVLVAPTSITADSPVSLQNNGIPKKELLSDTSLQKIEPHEEIIKPTPHKDEERIQVAKATDETRFAKDAESILPSEDTEKLRVSTTVDSIEVHNKPSPAEYIDELRISRSVESSEIQQVDEQKVSSAASVVDIEDLKYKINDLGSKLALTEQTAALLTEERNRILHEKEIIEKELALAKRKNVVKEVYEGYPLLYVYMVALFCLTFGYLMGL